MALSRFIRRIPLMIFAIMSIAAFVSIAHAVSLEDHIEQGLQAAGEGRYQEALSAWQTGLQIANQQGNKQAASTFIGLMGSIYEGLGQYEQALDHFQQTLAISREIGDRQGESSSFGSKGIVYRELGQHEQALEHFQKALNISREIGDRRGEGINLGNMAEAYEKVGQYEQALMYYQQTMSITVDLGYRHVEGRIFGKLGNVYMMIGQYEQALNYFQQAMAISIETGDKQGESSSLANIANVYEIIGQYEQAMENFQQALTIIREVGSRRDEGIIFGNMGVIFQNLGQYEHALDFYQQALTITAEIGYRQGDANALGNMGNVYLVLDQYEHALEHYQQALIISREIGDRRGEGIAYGNMGSVYVFLDQYEQALEHYQQALTISWEVGNRRGFANALANISDTFRSLGQYEEALEHNQQALTIFREIGNRRGEGGIRYNSGLASLALGRYTEAEEQFSAAIETFEDIRGDIRGEDDRTGFQSTLPPAYGALATAHIWQGQKEQAFNAIERGRSKSFLDLLGTRAVGSGQGLTQTTELLRLEQQLQALRQQQVDLPMVPSGTKTRSANLDKTITVLDKQRLELIDKIRRNHPELGDLVAVEPPVLREIQVLLKPGVLLLEYYHDGPITVDGKDVDQLWIFVVSNTGLRHVSVDVSKDELEQALNDYVALLAEPGSDQARLAALSDRLASWLLAPIARDIQNAKNIILVPWGPMFKVPLAALPLENGSPLLAGHNVVTAPSAGVYRYIVEKRNSGRDSVFALGNPRTALAPLPAAEREAAEVAALFPKSKVVTRDNATETLVKTGVSGLGNPDVIHFASHGIFNEAAPPLSHLALTPDQHNDGNLEMHEVYGLDLQGVSLVVMSACSSGRGKLGAGDDLIGLTRGFMFAGAPSVLSSLWDVDDEATRELMLAFYQNYISGMPKPEALRQAQLSMIQSPKWSHPNYWAGFVMFGDWM